MPNHLLTFEMDIPRERLFIYGDAAGLRFLADTLSRLAQSIEEEKEDHVDLVTQEWGGNELSSIAQKKEADFINAIKIYGLIKPTQKST